MTGENNKDDIYIALLVINLGGSFSNAYTLCRFLSRKFKIHDCVEIINNIINGGYVNYNTKDGVKRFDINESGNEALSQNKGRIIGILKERFPHEINIINNL